MTEIERLTLERDTARQELAVLNAIIAAAVPVLNAHLDRLRAVLETPEAVIAARKVD